MHLNQTQVAWAKTKVSITHRKEVEKLMAEVADFLEANEDEFEPEDVIADRMDLLEEKGYIQRCDRHGEFCLYITRKGLAA